MQVEIQNLTKTFGTLRANDAISLSFASGQIHGVLGENGAGKSTLMKLLSGFLQPDHGEVLLNGGLAQLGSPAAALAAGIGMVHQDPLDVPAFSALENFVCSSRAGRRGRAEARRRLDELAARLGFPIDPDTPVARLTVGQRQQLEIMRLLDGGVRLLILDEPTTGISAAQVRTLFAALKRLAADGATVLFVSHKLNEVAEICDTVSILRAGQVQGTGQMPMPQPVERLLDMMFGTAQDAEARAHAGVEISTPPTAVSPNQIASSPIWRLANVSTREGLITLRDLSLAIPAGTSVGLAGLEGSGQQLLLRLLAGNLRPNTGQVFVGDADLTGAPMARFRHAGVEYLPADRLTDGIIGDFSLVDHLEILRDGHDQLLNPAAATKQAKEAIAAYGIKATPTTPLAALSGGNQQRAMLALVPPHARGIVLDQPTRGLDVASARAVWGRLQTRKSAGAAVVYSSADLDELLDHSDMIYVFFSGMLSQPIPRAELDFARLAELIGGVGFEAQQ